MGEIISPTTDSQCPRYCVLVADVATDNTHNPSIIKGSLRSLKTDQFRQGVNV